jgi:hypothetical protein
MLVAKQRCLQLSELDAKASDLDLRIDASEILENSIPAPPRKITGPVELPCPIERRHNEPLPREVVTAMVAGGDARAPDKELAGDPDRHDLHGIGQHVQSACCESVCRSA